MLGALTDEQEAYRASFRDWLGSAADTVTVRKWLDAGDSMSFGERLRADGWSGVGVPEEMGGQGGGLLELALTAEELGRTAAPSAAWLASVVAAPLLGEWDDHGVPALLAPADSILHLAPRLELDPEGRVSGHVPHVLAGEVATRFVAPVRSADGPSLRVVDASQAQVTPRRLLDRSRTAADVRLDAVASEPIAVDDVALVEAAARMAVLVAADAMGAHSRMLDLAVAYARQRTQFGVPIGSFQAVKHTAAMMLVDLEAARSVVPLAAVSVNAPVQRRDTQWLLHAAAAKSQTTARAARAADDALTLHGAVGYTWEHDLQLFYKRARLDVQLGGSPGAWDDVIADGLRLA